MMKGFIPYEGALPYIFVSYSRTDSELMLEAMTTLREQNYRLWYDEGIPGGNDWPLYIAQHLAGAQAVIFFLSAGAMASPNCYSEMVAAEKQGKPTICVMVDESARCILTALREQRVLKEEEEKQVQEAVTMYASRRRSASRTPSMAEWMEALQNAIPVTPDSILSDASPASKLLTDRFKGDYQDPGRRKSGFSALSIGIAGCFCLLCALIYGGVRLYQYSTKQNESLLDSESEGVEIPVENSKEASVDPSLLPYLNTSIEFPDSEQERAIRLATGISSGAMEDAALGSITGLYFCGKTVLGSPEGITRENNRWYVNGAPVAEGKVSDLSLICRMYYLEELVLIDQQITAINKLKDLVLLKRLDVSGCPVEELVGLEGFQSLEILNLSHTMVKDLSGLKRLPALKTVYVSVDMLPLVLDPEAEYEVILVK